MLYMSDDLKGIFRTEQECLEYEKRVKQEIVKKEKLEMERQSRLNSINKKYEDLQKEIAEYRKDYDVRMEGYFSPFQELINMLYQ